MQRSRLMEYHVKAAGVIPNCALPVGIQNRARANVHMSDYQKLHKAGPPLLHVQIVLNQHWRRSSLVRNFLQCWPWKSVSHIDLLRRYCRYRRRMAQRCVCSPGRKSQVYVRLQTAVFVLLLHLNNSSSACWNRIGKVWIASCNEPLSLSKASISWYLLQILIQITLCWLVSNLLSNTAPPREQAC